MKNVKTNKRAIWSSVLALFLCFAMLIGTTFAWFTDSVTSAGNVIVTGNLDIKVEYTLDGENWADLQGATDLFQKGLWEPGHTEVVALKVTNAGSLALKYYAQMNILEEKIGKTKDGADIKLSDILQVSTLTQAANDVGEIALMLAFAGENRVKYETTTAFNANMLTKTEKELAVGDSHYIFIKVDMPETVGNEANHDGKNVPSIDFGINVFATQYASENDSFGNDYDEAAPIVTAPVARPDTAVILKGAEDVTIELSKKLIDALPAGVTEIGMSVSKPTVEGNTVVFDSIELVDQNGDVIDLDALVQKQTSFPSFLSHKEMTSLHVLLFCIEFYEFVLD